MQILMMIFGVMGAAFLAVQISIRQFRSTRSWEREVDAYTRVAARGGHPRREAPDRRGREQAGGGAPVCQCTCAALLLQAGERLSLEAREGVEAGGGGSVSARPPAEQGGRHHTVHRGDRGRGTERPRVGGSPESPRLGAEVPESHARCESLACRTVPLRLIGRPLTPSRVSRPIHDAHGVHPRFRQVLE
jgi:hypothetical protein